MVGEIKHIVARLNFNTISARTRMASLTYSENSTG